MPFRTRFIQCCCFLVAIALQAFSVIAEDEKQPADPPLPPAAERKVDFIKDIQPIFSEACYMCHGADAQEAGLRLDARKDAFDGGDSGRVILKGESAKSPLIHFVARIDPEKVMPPEDEGDPLTAEQVGLLRAWIDQERAMA